MTAGAAVLCAGGHPVLCRMNQGYALIQHRARVSVAAHVVAEAYNRDTTSFPLHTCAYTTKRLLNFRPKKAKKAEILELTKVAGCITSSLYAEWPALVWQTFPISAAVLHPILSCNVITGEDPQWTAHEVGLWRTGGDSSTGTRVGAAAACVGTDDTFERVCHMGRALMGSRKELWHVRARDACAWAVCLMSAPQRLPILAQRAFWKIARSLNIPDHFVLPT